MEPNNAKRRSREHFALVGIVAVVGLLVAASSWPYIQYLSETSDHPVPTVYPVAHNTLMVFFDGKDGQPNAYVFAYSEKTGSFSLLSSSSNPSEGAPFLWTMQPKNTSSPLIVAFRYPANHLTEFEYQYDDQGHFAYLGVPVVPEGRVAVTTTNESANI